MALAYNVIIDPIWGPVQKAQQPAYKSVLFCCQDTGDGSALRDFGSITVTPDDAGYLLRDGLRGIWEPAAPPGAAGPRPASLEAAALAGRAWFPILARLD
jgi:hypothetical protein